MQRRILIDLLKDAYAMEARSLPALRRGASDRRQSLDARLRLESHFRETEQHAERVRLALRALGSAPDTLPLEAQPIGVLAQNVAARVFSDPLVTHVIGELAAEHFEVAAYTAVIAAAEHAGESEVARLCRLNRGEDEDMAEWLDARIPFVIADTLERQLAPET